MYQQDLGPRDSVSYFFRSTLALYQIYYLSYFSSLLFLFVPHFTLLYFLEKNYFAVTFVFINFCFNLLATSLISLFLYLVRMIWNTMHNVWPCVCVSTYSSVWFFVCRSIGVSFHSSICLCFHLLNVSCSLDICATSSGSKLLSILVID